MDSWFLGLNWNISGHKLSFGHWMVYLVKIGFSVFGFRFECLFIFARTHSSINTSPVMSYRCKLLILAIILDTGLPRVLLGRSRNWLKYPLISTHESWIFNSHVVRCFQQLLWTKLTLRFTDKAPNLYTLSKLSFFIAFWIKYNEIFDLEMKFH